MPDRFRESFQGILDDRAPGITPDTANDKLEFVILSLLPSSLAVCRLPPEDSLPEWATSGDFFSVTRTCEETSIICHQRQAPQDVRSEQGWRALKVAGPLDFSLTGILASLAVPLAEAGVGILALSTFDTDYLLIRESQLEAAICALAGQGHRVIR